MSNAVLFSKGRAGSLALACIAAISGMGFASAAGAACGRISIFDNAPRQQDLHAATIISIDGHTPGTTGQEVYRVTPGSHVLEVSERIDYRYLAFNDRQRNAQRNYKKLTVDVAPDTTYSLAAKLDETHGADWRNGAYWNPTVWNETSETCH